MNSCEKEKNNVSSQAALEKRDSQEEFFFDHNTLTIDSCCARVIVRSNVYNPVDNFPIHHVLITKMDGTTETVVGQHNHGGWFGGTWLTDLNYPTHPYYWIMEFCFDSPGEYCFNLLLTGVNGPEPPQLGDPDPYDEHKICFEIEDCGEEEETQCIQYICWEMLAGCCDLDIVESITLADCDDNETTYSFGPHNVSGNYNVIVADILNILNGVNWGGNFVSYHNCKKCLKGDNENAEVPGFFFINSINVRIVSINGKKDCAIPPNLPNWVNESKPINDGCPEEDCFVCN